MKKFTFFLCAVFLTMIGYSQGSETFANLETATGDGNGMSSSYQGWTWTGDNGEEWNATDARTDQTINDEAITVRNGDLSTTIPGGIGDLTLTTQRVFSGGAGDITVSVNGTVVGTIPYDDTEQTNTLLGIDVSGDATLLLETPGNGDRVVMDDLTWTEASGGGDDCASVDLPFTQDFEDVTTPDIPNCASLETNVGASNGDGWYTSNVTSYGFSSNVLRHDYSSFSSPELDDWYFTQGINLETGVDYQISFKYGNNSTGTTYTEKLKVAYGTSAGSSDMDNELVDLDDIQGGNAEVAEIAFSVDQDGVYYFGFQIHSEASQYYLYVDDIHIDVAPTCIHTTDLTVDSFSTDSADISWTDGDGETDWEVLYGDPGFDTDSEGTSEDVTDLPNTTLDNLEDDTTYDVYVRAVCSENDKSDWEGPVSFTTNCVATDVPFTQDFEDVTTPDLPNCGTLETISGGDWKTAANSTFGSNVLNHSYGNDVDSWYFTQGINLETGVNYQISYKYSNTSTTWTEKLKVAYGTSSTADGMTEVLVDHDAISTTEVLLSEETFSVDSDGVYYFGFQAHSINNQNQLYVDDIHIDVAPTCLHTTDLTVDSFSTDSADISWTDGDGETDWEVLYGETGFDTDSEGTSEDVTVDPNTTLDNLEDDTTYDVYVRAVCSEEDKSYWEGPVTFSTNCVATDVPFTQDFEDVTTPDLPNCGTLETISGGDWKTAANSTFGSNVLNHSYDFNDDLDSWYFTQGINLETGVNYQISYKYTNNSTSFTEKLKVAYGTSASASAMTEVLVDHDAINTTDILLNEEPFSVDSDGVYYFGFQAHSINNQNQLYVDDISIIELSECADATAGTPEETEFQVCANAPFTISVNGASTEDDGAEGLTGQWEVSTDSGDTWAEIDGATGPSYFFEDGITEESQFQYVVSCDFDDSTDTSPIIMVTINTNTTECYCVPEGTNSGRYINNFSATGNGDQEIDNQDSGFSVGGYGDFTSMTVEQAIDGTIDFTADIEGGSAGFRIWVDWNQDGQFDTTEEVAYQSDGYSALHSGSFTVPEDALEGTTRMRIVSHWLSTTGDVDPCETGFTYGEFEDYILEVPGDDDGGTFPGPYCDIADPDEVTVEEITAVDLAGTSITNDDTDSVLIDKTETVVNVTAGETYTLEVEGNTSGDFDNDIIAFIDWNQNEVLDDDGEMYEVGTLENSTGDDGTSVSLEITVPEDAVLGTTRIRITKTYTDEVGEGGAPPSPALINPCAIEFDAFGMGPQPGFGQALDFTLQIEEADDTSCASIVPPWNEDFESGTEDTVITSDFNCWNIEYESGDTDWSFYTISYLTSDLSPHGGNLMAGFQTSSTGNSTKLVSPKFDLSNLDNPQLTFYYGQISWLGDVDELRVYYKHSASDPDWTLIDGAEYTAEQESWEEVELTLPEADGATDYVIAFEATSNYAKGVYLDDISITSEDDGGGGDGEDCSQEYDGESHTALGFSGDNVVANDVLIDANSSFTIETVTIEFVATGGEPESLDLEIYEDNGSGGVGDSTGATFSFDSSNMSFEDTGELFAGYPIYSVEMTLDSPETLNNDTDDTAHYWLAIGSVLSTTGDFTYWNSSLYDEGDSYPSWQYLADEGSWAEYFDDDGNQMEGIMMVEGVCGGDEGGGGDCEDPTDITFTGTDATSTNVAWTENGSATEWEVVYGAPGFNPNGAGTSVMDDDNDLGVLLENLDPDTTYDVYVRAICGEDEQSDWEGPESFTTEDDGEPGDSYCEGEGVNFIGFGGIENFSTSDGIDNIDNQGIETPIGYHDFTDMIVSQAVGESFTFTVDIQAGTFSDAGIAVYIDYNNNFEFESNPSELVYTTISFEESITATITVPADTDLGNYRLRVVSDGVTPSPDPCNAVSSIQDYTLTVIEGDTEDCPAPSDITFANTDENSTEVSWTENGSATEWEVVYGAPGFNPNGAGTSVMDDDGALGVLLENLDPDTTYDVYVRAICETDNESDFTGPEQFTTDMMPCPTPTDIVVDTDNITDTSADVSWTPGGNETQWEVIYGESGFDLDANEGTSIEVNDTPETTITDLDPDTAYDVYVIAICDPDTDNSSEAAGPETFNTELGIDNHDFENFTYYPNPVNNQLTLKAGNQIEQVEVYNLLGQSVMSSTPNQLQTQLNTERLQSGVYLMKVTINDSVKTFRVIKK